jgi:cytochrome P450
LLAGTRQHKSVSIQHNSGHLFIFYCLSQALSWAYFRLCTNPDCQQKAREEVLQVLKSRNIATGAAIPYEVLQEMKYLEAVCMETLRMHPSVPKEGKYALKDDILPDGTIVRAGEQVGFIPWVMGRDEKIWPKAHEFAPERFLGSNSKPSPFMFIAFQVSSWKESIVSFLLLFSSTR